MKDINFFGKLAQLQTMQYFFRALFNEGFKPPAPSVCADGEVLPVSQTEVYRTVLQNSGEPCPLLGSKARQKKIPIHSPALQVSRHSGFHHKLTKFLYEHYYIIAVTFCGGIFKADY